ncbi:hypothetical protein SUGI_1168130 [Cryptomeria japonica]|nr:hypothetical protein SUGI_1168130 [Cryptomeria japonica]
MKGPRSGLDATLQLGAWPLLVLAVLSFSPLLLGGKMLKDLISVDLYIYIMFMVVKQFIAQRNWHGCNNGFHAKKNSSLGGLALGLVRRGGGIAQAIERSKERLHMFLKDPESPIHAGNVNDPASKTSPLLFGDSADLRGSGIKSTPIVTNEAQPTFYYLDLQGVSVDGSRLSIPHGTFDIKADGSGGVIIDSGTTITYLEQDGYDSVKTAVQASMKLREADGSRIGLDLCYKLPFDSSAVKVPAITFHFAGADFYLPGQNAFYRDEESQLFCLAMAASNGLSIFGNIQQQNYHILYDLGINRELI